MPISPPDNANIAAIKAKTDNLPDDPAATSDLSSVAPTTAEITSALQAVANDFKADVSALATSAQAVTINEGVKKASLLIPHNEDVA